MEFFRVPETLEPEDDALELLDSFIQDGNNLGIRADDVAGLAQEAGESGSAFGPVVDSTVKRALLACESLQQEPNADFAEELKICLYLATLVFFKMSEADKEQTESRKKTKKGTKAAAEVSSPHIESVWKLLELFKKVTSLPKSRVNDVVHGKSLIEFCQQMALKVAVQCGRASRHEDSLGAICASAESFDTLDRVADDVKSFLEEDETGPAVVVCISKHSAALGREVLSQVMDDMRCMDGKDKRVGNIKEFLTAMAKSCMDLLAPNLMFLQSILQSSQDTFATTILQCFLQHVLQGCAEPSGEADSESTSCSAMTIVAVFDTRTRDKTCAVRVAALQCISQLAEHGLLPTEMYASITDSVRERLVDKLVSARKQAMHTMEAVVTRNPYGNVLSEDVVGERIQEDLTKLASKIEKRRSVRRASMAAPPPTQDDSAPVPGNENEDGENVNPNAEDEAAQQKEQQAQHIREIMQKHKPHKEFVEAVHKIVPELGMLLMYDQESDVSGAVGLLKYLRAFDVPGASTALIKALRLVNCSMPTARGVIVDMFSEVYISNKDYPAVVAGLLQLLESEPSLALESSIKTCMQLSLETGAEVQMHRVANVCIGTAKRHMSQPRPQLQDVHRAELCVRLLTIFAEMKPAVCCGHLEELLAIRTCILRVNNMGGTRGVLLQNALVKIILLMAGDPACRTEVVGPEAMKRIAAVLLTVRGQHCFAVVDTVVAGLYVACKEGKGSIGELLRVLTSHVRTSIQEISKVSTRLPSQCSGMTSPPQSSASQAGADAQSPPGEHSGTGATDAPAVGGCVPEQSTDDMNCDDDPLPDADSAPAEGSATASQELAAATQQGATPSPSAATSAQQQAHNACCALSYAFALFGAVALRQSAFIEQRMEQAQRKAESMPAKKNTKETDHAMAGVFHCADVSDDQEALQAELLDVLRTASDTVLAFFKSKLLTRANTCLRLHAVICVMRLANIDSRVAEHALPIMFLLLEHGYREKVEPVVAKQIVGGLADLLYNRPSLMMQYSKKVFDILLQEHHQHMRLYVTRLVIKLVLGGVLRFKEGIGKLIYLLVDENPQVQHQVEYLFKKLHEQDKTIIFAVFPEVLRSLCESQTLTLKEKESILGALSSYVTADKQNRSLIENILGRMMVELKDVNAAKFCLHGVKLFKSGAETSASIVKSISSVALPLLGEKLEDAEFAKLLLETTNNAFNQFKRARKGEESRITEMQAAVKQVQDVVASYAHDEVAAAGDGTDEIEGNADAAGEAGGEDTEMQDSQEVGVTQGAANE